MLRVAIVGCGFMGSTHARAWRHVPDATVAVLVDADSERAAQLADSLGMADLVVHPSVTAALKDTAIDAVDICLPTDLHRDCAVMALDRGLHVFCEKPIALTLEDAAEMESAAVKAQRHLFVGHCVRYWPEYVELKRVRDSGELGQLLSLSLTRRAGRPTYSAGDWVNQADRCIGAALDLHIHDTDFVRHVLGTPGAVFSSGVPDESGWNSISTHYLFDGVQVSAEGAWNHPAEYPFRMTFTAVFTGGVLEYDSRSEPSLWRTAVGGSPEPVRLAGSSAPIPGADPIAYADELAAFAQLIASGTAAPDPSAREATESLRIVLAEISSAAKRQPEPLLN